MTDRKVGFNLRLDPATHASVKATAAARGLSIREHLHDLIRETHMPDMTEKHVEDHGQPRGAPQDLQAVLDAETDRNRQGLDSSRPGREQSYNLDGGSLLTPERTGHGDIPVKPGTA